MAKRLLSIAFIWANLVTLGGCTTAPPTTVAECERQESGRVVEMAGALALSILTGADMRGTVPPAQDCHKLKPAIGSP